MTEHLNFSFTPNRSDYIKTWRAFSFQHATTKIAILLSLLIIALILTSILYLHTLSIAGFSVLLVMVIYYLSIFFLAPANMADKVAKDEKLNSEMFWVVDDNEVCVGNKFADMDCEWNTFAQTYETNEHFLLVYASNKNMFQLIPKRAFKTVEQLATFRKLLENKTHGVKQIISVNLPELSRNLSMVILYAILVIFIIIVAAYSFTHGVGRL